MLDELEENIGEHRRLRDCHGRMDWHKRGVYFFFKSGETRTVKPSSSRVVRVGASTRLWEKIRDHRRTLKPYGGYHCSSIFRLLIRDATCQRNPELILKSLEQEEPVSPEARKLKCPHETRVGEYLADMTLLLFSMPDASRT